MRIRLLGLAGLLVLSLTAIGSPVKARALPFCPIYSQECVGCGSWEGIPCEQLCTDYLCDDGTSYTVCGGCSCSSVCTVP